jgi:NDP-sugar pyrophosphorylase family protein
VHAIVMAAGEGRRLRPLTERWPKPVLPIDGRPVIATLLHELRAAACRRVTVVTGHLAEQVERLLGDGSGFGLELVYARQPRPDGSADAVARGLAAGAHPPLLVTTADTVFKRGDIARFGAAFEAAGTPGALAIRRDPPAGPSSGVDVETGRVTAIGGQAAAFAHASLWGFGQELASYLEGLGGPPYELADAYRRAIADGLEVSAFEVGRTRDLTDALDLVEENFVYLSESE